MPDELFPLTDDQVKTALNLSLPEWSAPAGIAALLRLLQPSPDPPSLDVKAYKRPFDAARAVCQATHDVLVDMGWPQGLAYLFAVGLAAATLAGGALGLVVLWLSKNILPDLAS